MSNVHDFYHGKKYSAVAIGLTAASTWTWAPALILSTDIAANKGLYGLLSFIVPNIMALVLFAFIGKRMNPINLWENTYIRNLYHVGYGMIELFCVIIQVTAGASVFSKILGFSYNFSVLLFMGIALSISLLGGLHGTVRSNVWQHIILILLAIGLLCFAPISYSPPIQKGIFSAWDTFIYSIILFTAPIMTNQHWQRSNKHGYFWGSFFFSIPLICMGIIGLFSGGHGDYISLMFNSGVYQWMFLALIFIGLSSTVQSALSSIIWLFGGEERMSIGRFKMICLCVVSLVVVFGNFKLMALWKTMGFLRLPLAVGVLYGLHVKRREDSLFATLQVNTKKDQHSH